MTDFTDHQAALRKQNMESINYRAQMVNDYAPLGEDIIKPSRFGWMIWPALVLGACFSLWLLKQASAAERERPHDLWLLVKPTATLAATADSQRNQFKIGVAYPSKSKCESVKREMRKVAGSLQCQPLQGE